MTLPLMATIDAAPVILAQVHNPTGVHADDDVAPIFDADQVPIKIIEVPNPDAAWLSPNQYEVIGHKESYPIFRYSRVWSSLRC
ncbi:MAG: hypothetical protein M0T84_18265 [Betaproteobacteria bacterium]|nr:hypothetical protein [Betaproteobacteria bacterium]